jgi:hypothetical protein
VEVKIFVTREGGPTDREDNEDEEGVVDEEAKDAEKMEAVVDTDAKRPEKTKTSVAASVLLEESRGFSVTYLSGAHPDLSTVVQDYIGRSPASGGRIQVVGCGLARIESVLRGAVARCNDGAKVRRGEEKWNVGFYWDDRPV